MQRAPAAIIGIIVLAAVIFVASSLRGPQLDEYQPTPPGVSPQPDSTGAIRYTIDATADAAWQHFSFARGAVVARNDSLGWDVAFQRFHIKTRDPRNAIERWYDYSWTSHVLKPRPDVWIVRTPNGQYALRILSYYCAGAKPGCITFEYVYQGSGQSDVAS